MFAMSCGPPPSSPPSNAALILSEPCPGMSTHRSRGKESTIAFWSAGSVWTSMIVSARVVPPMSLFVPNWCCSSIGSPARESDPSNR